MRQKYRIIFLMGLLCLISNDELLSQHCLTMSYDKNGNRIGFASRDCGQYFRDETKSDDKFENICESYTSDFLVCPNPNNGKFKIELKEEGMDDSSEVYIYDNKGILVDSQKFAKALYVDISNNPSGVYLLRILKGDNVISGIVVKL